MSGMGDRLREARERLGVSVEDVAHATRLKPQVVEAMERDDRKRLIAPAYAKGFYKLYCEYLGMDPEPFVQAYLGKGAGTSAGGGEENGGGGFFSRWMQSRKAHQDKERRAREIREAQEKRYQIDKDNAVAQGAGAWEIEAAKNEAVTNEVAAETQELPAVAEEPEAVLQVRAEPEPEPLVQPGEMPKETQRAEQALLFEVEPQEQQQEEPQQEPASGDYDDGLWDDLPTEDGEAADGAEDDSASEPEPELEPEPEPEPEPAPVRDPIPVPVTTKPKPTRPPIDTSKAKLVHKTVPTTTRRIVPAPSTRPPPKTIGVHTRPTFSGPRLTPEEIRKLLDMGATVSDHTSIPADELHRCYALIQRQLYAAWVRPAAVGGGREPVVSISIRPGGFVQSASLKTPSGNPELDRSALEAAQSVKRFTGLSEDFIRENPTFTVAFKLEE
jgi:TonB family protein